MSGKQKAPIFRGKSGARLVPFVVCQAIAAKKFIFNFLNDNFAFLNDSFGSQADQFGICSKQNSTAQEQSDSNELPFTS